MLLILLQAKNIPPTLLNRPALARLTFQILTTKMQWVFSSQQKSNQQRNKQRPLTISYTIIIRVSKRTKSDQGRAGRG